MDQIECTTSAEFTKSLIFESMEQLMDQITSIRQIHETDIGTVKTIIGWVTTIRKQKDLIFIKVHDDSETKIHPLQIVVQLHKIFLIIQNWTEHM